MTDRILIARIGAPHGVKGEVRLFIFADEPEAVLDYEPLTDATGRRSFKITTLRPAKEHFVARLAGIDDRTAAETLTNVDLYVPRDALPETEDEDTFYHADLLGLRVENEAGEPIGTVLALHDFGAGDVLEYSPTGAAPGRTLMVPFTRVAVPVVDVAGGRVVLAADFIETTPAQPEPGEDTEG